MYIFETISLILCVVIFIVAMAVLNPKAIELINQYPHKCKNCDGDMKIVDLYVFPDSNGNHGIVWYECTTCGRKEEIDY